MRFTKTVVIHLLIDLDAPEKLIGDFKTLPDSKVFSFKSQEELILLLRQSISQAQKEKTHEVHI